MNTINVKVVNALNVKIKKLDKNAVIPAYAHKGDMCMDLTAIDITYNKEHDYFEYHTGLAFEIPEGYGMLIHPRSSNRKTAAYMPNSVSIIDSGYRGEVTVCFKNIDAHNIVPPYKTGERIAQLWITPVPFIEFEEVEELSDSERGTGGYGSTGK